MSLCKICRLGRLGTSYVQEHIYLAQVLRSVESNQAVKKKKKD